MNSDHVIAVLGGDQRQFSVARKLAAQGFTVRVFGLPQEMLTGGEIPCDRWQDAVVGAALVVLPLPASPDGVRLHLPLAPHTESPLLSEIFDLLPHDAVLAGGKFTPHAKKEAEEKEIRLFDYFDSEELQQKNALPTAEGAVSILMREMPCTVSGLSVGVTGYGRVSKALCRLLLAMGAHVTVAARKAADIEKAAASGCQTVHLLNEGSLTELTASCPVIFNTVPHWIFSRSVLAKTPQKTLMIDLASSPGGIDAAAASARGIRVIWALSLPGKYSPDTAGEIIAETLLSHMEREGVV